MSDTIRRFKAGLEDNLKEDYRHIEPPVPGRAHIRFTGTFQGDEVLWDAVIVTLSHEFREHHMDADAPAADFSLPQYIEVGAASDAMRTLRVGLNVPHIDEATLRKTIIMIRNYKLLHPGRHEYEPAWKP